MKKQQWANPLKRKNKGQSLVELMVILIVILTLLIGMVEFGNMLNQYIGVVDAAREGARFGSYSDPGVNSGGIQAFCTKVYLAVQLAFRGITLDPNTDDVIVTVFSIRSNYPAHVPPNAVTLTRFNCPDVSLYKKKSTKFPDDNQIASKMEPAAPSSGIVLVEVFYAYHQLTGLMSSFLDADGAQLHAYSIMPLSAAEPTPTP
jgi:hypothetical protein